MIKTLLVGAGGFIGSVLRYFLNLYIQPWANGVGFPYATLIVNLLGCLIIGFLSEAAEARGALTAEARVFIFVGLLGGFTTFSSFGNETVELWRGDKHVFAFANIAGHLIAGLGAVYLGRSLAQFIRW